jgi:peptide/nickel transport system substrate-binding protein
MKKAKDSRKGISTTVVVAAIVLIIIVVVAALYVLELPPFARAPFEGIIMGTTDSVESAIDPSRAWDFFGWEIIQNTGCTLVEIEPGSSATAEDFNPALATDWDLSADEKTWTFTLRQGVLFEDGTEFNASHVKYSYDRAMGIAHPDGMPVGMEFDTIIDSVEVVSKYVVKFNLVQPFGPFLPLISGQAFAIVNPEYAGGWKTDWDIGDIVYFENGTDARTRTPMDLGPYKLTQWKRVGDKDDEMRLEANPNYWNKGAGLPKTEKIIIKFYADDVALRLAIEAGDIDVAFRHISATDIETLKDNPDVTVWQGVGAAIQYMIFQEDPVGTLPQLDDARIRRALTACLNRSEVCTTVFLDQASPLYSIIPDGMLGHTEAFAALGDANYTLTRSLLADPTIPGGPYNETNKLEIELWYETSGHYPSSAEQVQVYKSQFEASGVITVRSPLQGVEWSQYVEYRQNGVMDIFLYGWYPDYIDPDNYAFLYYAGWLNHHYIDYNATNNYIAMKAAYDAARASSVDSERTSLYAEIDDYAAEDCPVVPIWQGAAWAVTKPNIKGVYLDITQTWRIWTLYEEE